MDTTLVTCFYVDRNADRQLEITTCLQRNLHAGFKKIILLTESDEATNMAKAVFPDERITILQYTRRPTFNDYFNVLKVAKPDEITVICNSDIFLIDISSIREYYDKQILNKRETVLALSRWDYYSENDIRRFFRPDSQDAWIFYGNHNFKIPLEFSMGYFGCDNRLAYELKQLGFNLINPCSMISIYHYHVSGVRNIATEENRQINTIPPPYSMVNPI